VVDPLSIFDGQDLNTALAEQQASLQALLHRKAINLANLLRTAAGGRLANLLRTYCERRLADLLRTLRRVLQSTLGGVGLETPLVCEF
jgi:hypothetical protein